MTKRIFRSILGVSLAVLLASLVLIGWACSTVISRIGSPVSWRVWQSTSPMG